mmetsp:Transcript_10624/g.23812  ORF Transcript_10624/g.23812 Transcript_10624/m.23812 type:complete len:212 (+) Transcript_10624:167-802(+)
MTPKQLETKYLKTPPLEIPKEDIQDLLTMLQKEMKQRRSVGDIVKEMEQKCNAIDWGYGDWKSEKVSDGVSELEGLDSLITAALKLILEETEDNVQNQWEDALKLTLQMVSMINTAESNAGKLVNGSMGEYCPEMAFEVEALWADLVTRGKRPPDSWLETKLLPKLKGCLGDYEDSLPATLKKLRPSTSNKRQKTCGASISAGVEVVDLTV